MLVLSRKKNESIVINNDITVVVVEIRGDKVRLGVEAPKEIPVHRREVYDAIKRGEMERKETKAAQRSRCEGILSRRRISQRSEFLFFAFLRLLPETRLGCSADLASSDGLLPMPCGSQPARFTPLTLVGCAR